MSKDKNKKEEEINLDDQYKAIVEANENESSVESEEPKNLGKVDMSRFQPAEAKEADFHLGYHSVKIDSLPSGGMFYTPDTEISIRSAKVAEIRHFSTMDETNILDVDEKLNAIVESCLRITSKKKRLSYKDILEEDRFWLILAIRDLTFPEPENALTVKYQDKRGVSHDASIDKKYFQYFSIPEELDKYYDQDKRTFIIETKSFGNIEMRPPTIGLMQKVTKYIKEKQEKGLQADQSLIQLIPYLYTDWRGFDDKSIFNFEVELNGWNNRKYALVYKLAEKMKVGIQPEMLVTHEDDEVLVPIGFRDGIKSIFLVQDIAGELL
jgi:hypothetical protein